MTKTMSHAWRRSALCALAFAAAGLLAGCEFGPKQVTQSGFRGTGMAQIQDKDLVAYLAGENALPEAIGDPAPTDGQRAGEFYENVQALGDLSTDEFNRLMLNITQWVVPAEYRDNPDNAGGCNYCHNAANLASDEVYQKVVARKMFRMTRTINTSWTAHVKETGVTCWTCHRGQAIPKNYWTRLPEEQRVGFIGSQAGQNKPIEAVGWTTSPTDPFSPYLGADDPASIRVNGMQSLRPPQPGQSIRATETSLGLMQHMSVGLGVNCTFCHNTRAFASWQTSTPQRVTAWHGLQMVPAINKTYMEPLAPVFPANRLGPTGDVFKINCATCHIGANKPMLGASMRDQFPELWRAGLPVPAATTLSLPSGASLSVPAGSIGEQLFKFLQGTDPTPKSFVFDNLFFDTGSAGLTAESRATVEAISQILKAFPNATATIDGYTDNQGEAASNLTLSKGRAKTVFDGLVGLGVPAPRLGHDGFGDAKPIGDNATEEGRAKNRRIELTVTKR